MSGQQKRRGPGSERLAERQGGLAEKPPQLLGKELGILRAGLGFRRLLPQQGVTRASRPPRLCCGEPSAPRVAGMYVLKCGAQPSLCSKNILNTHHRHTTATALTRCVCAHVCACMYMCVHVCACMYMCVRACWGPPWPPALSWAMLRRSRPH